MLNDHQHHVYLSYSNHDTDVMRRVRDDLRAEGLTVWADEGLEPGTPQWDKSIEDALKNAHCMVVILSPDANQADSIHTQISIAQKMNLRIFPVIARGDEWSAIPKVLIGTQMIDIRANHNARMKRLVELIRNHSIR